MSHLLRWLFNPGILISVITIVLVYYGEGLLPLNDRYGLIYICGGLLVYVCFAWYTSTRPLGYQQPRQCVNDILADLLAYTANISACFLWYFLAPQWMKDAANTLIAPEKYYSILFFLIFMSIATAIELAFTATNSLRAMYLRNPINIER